MANIFPSIKFNVFHTPRGAFSPDQISNLELWLEADEGVTITGTGVSDWDDNSDNDYDAIQGIDANRPGNPSTVINGKSVIRFDESNVDRLTVDSGIRTNFHANHSFTIGMVMKKDVVGSASAMGLIASATASANRIFVGYTDDRIELYIYNGTLYKASGTGVKGSFYVIIGRWNFATITLELWINGVLQVGTTALTGNGTVRTVIGALNDEVNNNFDGDIAEIIIYSSSLGSTDRDNVENYLNTKYNIY